MVGLHSSNVVDGISLGGNSFDRWRMTGREMALISLGDADEALIRDDSVSRFGQAGIRKDG